MKAVMEAMVMTIFGFSALANILALGVLIYGMIKGEV